MIEAERVTDRHHPLADPHVVGITKRRDRQIVPGINLEQRDVGLRIAPDHRALYWLPSLVRDHDLAGVLDHMVVGQNVAGSVDDEAGTEAPAVGSPNGSPNSLNGSLPPGLRCRHPRLQRTPGPACSVEILTTVGPNLSAIETKSGSVSALGVLDEVSSCQN